ncbi:MAG: hypothetical protein FJ319_04395 [SAR202 cluster bacterium]|nr:hypothetical protein [SAR202 cluster bacterium]
MSDLTQPVGLDPGNTLLQSVAAPTGIRSKLHIPTPLHYNSTHYFLTGGDAMKPNKLIELAREGKRAHGFTLTWSSTTVIELMALAGFDFVQFDSEHGPFTPESLDDLVRICEMVDMTPIARVPNIEPDTILRFLDRGMLGIMGPHITDGGRARKLAESCRFAPEGKRSYGSSRAATFGRHKSALEYMQWSNANIIVIAQLEDVESLKNIDEILAVKGIDYYTSGPNDIAQSMGLLGQPNHPRVKEFEAKVRERVHGAGKRMYDEITSNARVWDLFINAGQEFVKAEKAKG